MAYSGVLDDVRKCINLGVPERLPIFALSEEFDTRIAGFTYEQYASCAENVFKSQSEGVERFDYDWVNVYIADSLDFEPLGAIAGGGENIPPSIKHPISADYDTLNKLKVADPKKDGRLPILLEAISKLKNKWGDKLVVCGRVPAPFSSVTLLYGMDTAMTMLYDNPQLFIDTMKFFNEHELTIAKAQIEAGADAIWVGDCSASSRFISLDHYKNFTLDSARKIISDIKEAGGITFYYTAEPKIEYLKVMIQAKPDVIALPEEADLLEVKKQIGDKICLTGNIDPIRTLLNGTPQDVTASAKWIKENVGKLGGHIFNSGEGVPRDTSEENVRAMMSVYKGN